VLNSDYLVRRDSGRSLHDWAHHMPHSELDLALFYYDLAIREMERMARGQVKLIIVHRYGVTSTDATRSIRRVAGTEIVSASLIFRGKSYRLPQSTTHLILLDYLCRHCIGIGQNAAEIEAGLNEQLFYVHHASTAIRDVDVPAAVHRHAGGVGVAAAERSQHAGKGNRLRGKSGRQSTHEQADWQREPESETAKRYWRCGIVAQRGLSDVREDSTKSARRRPTQ